MATINRETGEILKGIDDVWQSVGVILSTAIASLVEARDMGSQMPRIVDRSISPLTLIDIYAAVPEAIHRTNPETNMPEEPRFRLRQMQLADMTAEGHTTFDIEGVYYPRGHLGDYSEAQDARGRVILDQGLVITSEVAR